MALELSGLSYSCRPPLLRLSCSFRQLLLLALYRRLQLPLRPYPTEAGGTCVTFWFRWSLRGGDAGARGMSRQGQQQQQQYSDMGSPCIRSVFKRVRCVQRMRKARVRGR